MIRSILGPVKPFGDLPGHLTAFVGRRTTLELVCQRLTADRLVTLVGPGGCGKTRLGVEVGRMVADRRPQGVFFVDLSGLSEPGLVPNCVLQVLGLRSAPGHDPVEVLVARLSNRELLIILDNCEHLLNACASLAAAIAAGCPGLWTLATSRESLGVNGEVIVRLEGLELPDRDKRGGGDWVTRSEAGTLFIDRALRACPGFLIDDAGVEAVARICERLDGIPLAIELAAARTSLMSVEAIANGLSDRFRLLVGKGQGGPTRHRSLLASIEWSCGLLTEAECALLWRLSVFASGFTLAAAEAVCAGGEVEPEHVLGLLISLVDKCLVEANAGADRFRLHETMRAYAGAALAAEDFSATIRDHHLVYFSVVAEAMGPKWLTSALAIGLVEFEADLDNFRAALDWSVESGQFHAGADLMWALTPYFFVLGLWPEGLARCRALLTAELPPVRRANLLENAGHFARNSDPAASLRIASEMTELRRSLGDDGAVARGLALISNVQAWAEPEAALRTADEAEHIARAARQPSWVASVLSNKAWAYFWLGRTAEALSLAEETLRDCQDRDELWYALNARINTSIIQTYCGRPARALEEAEVHVQQCTELGSPTFACWGERHRAEAYIYMGDARAFDALARSRALAESVDDTFNLACTETRAGLLQVSLGRDEEGYALIEAGISKLEALGFARMCVRDRALLAEVALRRGDHNAARCHLRASAWRLPRAADPEGVPILRAEARLAREEGSFQLSHSLACDGLEAAATSGQRLWAIDLLELAAITASDLGRHAEAARLLGAAESQRELTGYNRWAPARDELAPVLVALESSLGHDAFDRSLSEGRALSLEQAAAYAYRGRGSHTRAVTGWDSLTPAERRVVSLVAEGLTNAEIARQLFVSAATVKSHLTRVFDKLGVINRSQLVREAKVQPAAHRG